MSDQQASQTNTSGLAYFVFFILLVSLLGGIIHDSFITGVLIGCLLVSGVVGLIGKNRRIGFAGAFFLSLFLSPLVGLIAVFMSPTLKDEAYKERMMELTEQGTQPVSSFNTADQLYKLNELRKEGVLTQEEFEAEKAKILAAS